MTVNAVTGEHI